MSHSSVDSVGGILSRSLPDSFQSTNLNVSDPAFLSVMQLQSVQARPRRPAVEQSAVQESLKDTVL